MPSYNSPMASSASDGMYDDAEMAGTEESKPEAEEKDSGEETALLPKSILAGKKFDVGDEVMLKIVRFHGDEVEVAYATDKGGEGDKGEYEEKDGPPPPPPPPRGGMAGYME